MADSIMVVDDDACVRDLIVRIVRDCGYVVVAEAGLVSEALAQAERLMPKVALVDVGLPDGDGFCLARRLTASVPGIRVVVFSSDADRSNEVLATRAGAVGFLPKDELSGPALRRLLGGGPDDEG